MTKKCGAVQKSVVCIGNKVWCEEEKCGVYWEQSVVW